METDDRGTAAERFGSLTGAGAHRGEPATAATLAVAAVAGLVAAVVGGIAWGLIVKWSEYEIGFVAWGIGFVVGMAVLLAARGRKGLPLQAIAIVAALIGILIGKYLSFALILQDAADAEGVELSLFGADMRQAFQDELGTVFALWDLLWIGLAVVTAWQILQPEEAEAEPAV
jgi:hypothetical protein